MREPRCLIGVDIGGTAVKVGLFCEDGTMLGLASQQIPVSSPRPGWAEMMPGAWYAACKDGIRQVLEISGTSSHRIAGLGLSNMIGTVAPLGGNGEPLAPAIAYYDTRSGAQAQWVLERIPEVLRVTGNRVTAGNTSICSALWIRDQRPDMWRQTAALATAGSWLFQRLTGQRMVDWTTASFYGLFDYRTKSWSDELADGLGLSLDLLPPIASPLETRRLTAPAAQDLGLPSGLPVTLGGIDGAMSSVGLGAIGSGDAYDVSGTSEMIALCLDEPKMQSGLLGRWHVVPDVWVLIGAISTPGAAFRWIGEMLGFGASSGVDFERMTAEASQSPPGANGILFLPHMMGERSPIWDPNARGVLHGLSLGTQRADLIRAVMEGGALAMRHVLELINTCSGQSVSRVTATGGAASNDLWCQIKADIWGIELALPHGTEATVLGAAMTAGVATGVYDGFGAAVDAAVQPIERVVAPDAGRQRAYAKPYHLYRQLYPSLAHIMHESAEP